MNKIKKANLPVESAREPEEEARQPSPQDMPSAQNNEPSHIFASSAKLYRQNTSSYQNILSQTPKSLSQREKLQWLQQKRTKGLWVQCDDCDRWRYLSDVLDRYELPKTWYCRMHPDLSLNKCSAPEVPISLHGLEDLVYSDYAAGSIVVARLGSWPWWPAMVDDCPDTEQYYWLDGFSDIPTHYHVVFFDAFEVTRAWMTSANLKPYSENKGLIKSGLKNRNYRKRLEVAVNQANDAEKLSLEARLKKYSFITRYKGQIVSPRKFNTKYYKKYQEQFKRKFNVDLPEEFSDLDNELSQSQDGIKQNNIALGKKKKTN